MSKEYYVVNCYTCQHNGQETCKGCNTLLNGEDEPYQNWKLREDLQYKDNKIEELQSQLAEKDYEIKVLYKALNLACETIKQMCGKPLWIGGNIPSPEPKDSEYFKDIAKEMLENE